MPEVIVCNTAEQRKRQGTGARAEIGHGSLLQRSRPSCCSILSGLLW